MLCWIKRKLFTHDEQLFEKVRDIDFGLQRFMKEVNDRLKTNDDWCNHFEELAQIKDYKIVFLSHFVDNEGVRENLAREGYHYSHSWELKEYWVKSIKAKPKAKAKR